MRDFVILLGLTIVFMVGVIAGFFYLWYEHNALIRKVQSLEYQLEEHDGLIQANIDNTVYNGTMIVKLETYLGLNQQSCPEGCEDNCLFCPHAVESDT